MPAARRIIRGSITGTRYVFTGLLLSVLLLQSCATGNHRPTARVQSFQGAPVEVSAPGDSSGATLTVMTLNIAHGRGDSFHQLLQGSETTLANLDNIATVLRNTDPDVVALQEADGPSFWSGDFDHVEYLADRGSFSQSVHGVHVDAIGLSYGTALIANRALGDPQAVTFKPALIPVPKGFVVSTVTWPGQPCLEVDLVSLHLDFSSEGVRQRQAAELIETLRARQRPMIVMGDFNTGWHTQDSALRHISQQLALSAYRPGTSGLETFPAFGERLDWILVSPEFSFRSYRVVPDVVSDHLGVLAVLELSQQASPLSARMSCDGEDSLQSASAYPLPQARQHLKH